MAIAGAVLCVLRARFFRLLVLRFGTAIVWTEEDKTGSTQLCSPCVLRSASQRASAGLHSHGPRFNSAPQVAHSP